MSCKIFLFASKNKDLFYGSKSDGTGTMGPVDDLTTGDCWKHQSFVLFPGDC